MVWLTNGSGPYFQLFCQLCDSWVLCCSLLPMISFYRFSDVIDEKLGSKESRCLIQDGAAQSSKIAGPFVGGTRGTLLLPVFCLLEGYCPLILHKYLLDGRIKVCSYRAIIRIVEQLTGDDRIETSCPDDLL